MTNIANNDRSQCPLVIRGIGIILLGVMVLVTPWCLGSIHASVQVWLFPGVMLSLVCALLTLLMDGQYCRSEYRQSHVHFPVLLIPVLLMLLLVGLQLRPLDRETLGKRSP